MEASIDISKPGNVDAKPDKTSQDPREILSRANTTNLEDEPLMLDKEQAGKNEPRTCWEGRSSHSPEFCLSSVAYW